MLSTQHTGSRGTRPCCVWRRRRTERLAHDSEPCHLDDVLPEGPLCGAGAVPDLEGSLEVAERGGICRASDRRARAQVPPARTARVKLDDIITDAEAAVAGNPEVAANC